MFKRANKITSLLVAAASVATMIPAYAADVKKVDSQDGKVYDAVAYKNGTALIDAEVNDDDAAYYYKDGKYTALEDVDSGSDYSVYGSKYVKVDDGNDYNVDLETGKVLDNDVEEDDKDDVASALRKEIKDSDRYVDNAASGSDAYGDSDIVKEDDLKVIPGAKFSDNWYSAKYLVDLAGKYEGATNYAKAGLYTGTDYDNIFTDAKGNYIDADYNLGKIKVETTNSAATSNKTATIENAKDEEDFFNAGKVSGKIKASNVLGQDKDNIYRYAQIELTFSASVDVVKINNKPFAVNGTTLDLDVIQKISKAQDSDDFDDAKYAKNVYNYVISDDDAKLPSEGNTDAQAILTSAKDSDVKATVVGGKLVLYKVDNSSSKPQVEVRAMTLKSGNGYYYTDIEDDATNDAEYNTNTAKAAVDTDVDGNIYVIEDGYVKEFDGTDDWNKVYKVDGSFDGLSVYDKDNMVAWSQDDEVYSVIGGKDADTKTDDTTTPATTVTAGWAKNTDGSWSFNKADGTKATGWFQDTTGTWYYANTAGVMAANAWAQDSAGAWYYLGGSGAMTVNAWVQSGGKYYYVGANGAMLVNTTTPDGYWVGADGAWV